MSKELEFQKRIGYEGELKPVLQNLGDLYDIGKYVSHTPVLVGYEDFNVIFETDKGKFFVKMFATFRTKEKSKEYVDIMQEAIASGVNHPTLYSHPSGQLFEIPAEQTVIMGCVMQYLEGRSFYELRAVPTLEEMRFLARQAAAINGIDIQSRNVDDSWAVVRFLPGLEKNRKILDPEDLCLIEPLAKKFSQIDLNKLPHCLVHGDIIKTNALKDSQGKIWILDFSVADKYPRIQELAILFCNLLFDENYPEKFEEYYQLGLEEYQKIRQLTQLELDSLPIYIQAAHAMHVICPTYEKVVNHNTSEENEYWLQLGRIGLKYTSQEWSRRA